RLLDRPERVVDQGGEQGLGCVGERLDRGDAPVAGGDDAPREPARDPAPAPAAAERLQRALERLRRDLLAQAGRHARRGHVPIIQHAPDGPGRGRFAILGRALHLPRRVPTSSAALLAYAAISFGYFGWRLLPHPGRELFGLGGESDAEIF